MYIFQVMPDPNIGMRDQEGSDFGIENLSSFLIFKQAVFSLFIFFDFRELQNR